MVKELRADPRTRDIAIAMLTSEASVESETLAFAEGADDYMLKPVEPRRLAARVKALAARSRVAHFRRRRGSSTAMTELDAILKEFLVESREHLEQIESDLVTLEKNPTRPRNARAGVSRRSTASRARPDSSVWPRWAPWPMPAKRLLSDLRDARFVINPTIAGTLLALVDGVRRMLLEIERTGSEGDVDSSELIARLTTLHEQRWRRSADHGSEDPCRRDDAAHANKANRTRPAGITRARQPSCSAARGRSSAGAFGKRPRPRRTPRSADGPRRRAGADSQRDAAALLHRGARRPAGLRTASQRDHQPVAGGHHANPHAAHRHRVEQIPAAGARLRAGVRQDRAPRDGREADRARQDVDRSHPRPAGACAPQLHRSRPRAAVISGRKRGKRRKAAWCCARSTRAAR